MLLYVEPLLYLTATFPRGLECSLGSRLVCMPGHSWNQLTTHAFSAPPSLFCFMSNQACMVLFTSRVQASYSPPVTPTSSLTSQGDLSSLCEDVPLSPQGWDAQYVTQTVHSLGKISACVKLLLFWSPGKSCLNHFSFLSAQFSIGLTAVFVQSIESQVVFTENCSTYICRTVFGKN